MAGGMKGWAAKHGLVYAKRQRAAAAVHGVRFVGVGLWRVAVGVRAGWLGATGQGVGVRCVGARLLASK